MLERTLNKQLAVCLDYQEYNRYKAEQYPKNNKAVPSPHLLLPSYFQLILSRAPHPQVQDHANQ